MVWSKLKYFRRGFIGFGFGVPTTVFLYDELGLGKVQFCHEYLAPVFDGPVGILRGARALWCIFNVYRDLMLHTMMWNAVYEFYKEDEHNDSLEFMNRPKGMELLNHKEIALLYVVLSIWSDCNLDTISVDYDNWMLPAHERCSLRLYKLFTKNAALYAKFGQALTTIPILPQPYITRMKKLLDHVPTVSWREIEYVLFDDLEINSFDEMFLEFDKEPISAASLAQVHRAKLLNGKDVAVKLQYPQVRNYYSADMTAYKFIFDLIHLVFRSMDSPYADFFDTKHEGFHEVNRNLAKEIDFTLEEKNCMHSREFFLKVKPDLSIYCPFVERATKRVLVMEFIDNACNACNKSKILSMGLSPVESTSLIMEAFAWQLFCLGNLHSDPHEANCFVRRNPKSGKCQVVILDHGLYQELSPEFRESFTDYYISVVTKDVEKQKEYIRGLGLPEDFYRMYCNFVFMDNYDKLDFLGEKSSNDNLRERLKMFDQQHKEKMSKLDPEELNKRKNRFFRKVGDMSKHVPKEMRLILRNANILRSINQELGCPVNRLKINSRIAMHCHSKRDHRFGFIGNWYQSLYLEYRLFYLKLSAIFLAITMRLYRFFGYNPSDHFIDERAMES